MGYEQRAAFAGATMQAKDAILRNAPYFARYLPDYSLYEYRSPQNADVAKMPDVNAAVEADGFYLCDCCGDGTVVVAVLEYLRSVVETAGQAFVLEDL